MQAPKREVKVQITYAPPRRRAGFTLLELMIVVAIIGILAGIATPMYGDYVRRSKIIDATTAMGDVRTDTEKYFMDNRTYLDPGGACSILTNAKYTAYNGNPGSHFTMVPTVCTATTYTLRVDGKAANGMAGFAYTVDQTNLKTTVSVPAGWALPPGNCWALKKDGSC
jgi:type IV pilus assembly protein PilE